MANGECCYKARQTKTLNSHQENHGAEMATKQLSEAYTRHNALLIRISIREGDRGDKLRIWPQVRLDLEKSLTGPGRRRSALEDRVP